MQQVRNLILILLILTGILLITNPLWIKDPVPRVDYVPPRSVEQYCASATVPDECLDYMNNYFNGVYAP